MTHFSERGHYYIEVRHFVNSGAVSFDLSQHLPRRISVGPILVIAENPKIFLSVIKRRLVRLQIDITRESARTMNHLKKEGLQYELQRLESTSFTARGTDRARAQAQVCFIQAEEVATLSNDSYPTVYLTCTPSKQAFRTILDKLEPLGLLVTYSKWGPEFERILGARLP